MATFDVDANQVWLAFLRWDYLGPYQNSTPADISLYAGSDADGIVSVNDRFSGDYVGTRTFLDPRNSFWNVTSLVNDALLSGSYFGARLEVDNTSSDFLGGQFANPVLYYIPRGGRPSAVATTPIPASVLFLLAGVAGLAGVRRFTS